MANFIGKSHEMISASHTMIRVIFSRFILCNLSFPVSRFLLCQSCRRAWVFPQLE